MRLLGSMQRPWWAICASRRSCDLRFTGCDALVHVAADYRLWVRDPQQMYAANVDGTRELLRLARETGVQRVVYTSSVATMGSSPTAPS